MSRKVRSQKIITNGRKKLKIVVQISLMYKEEYHLDR